MILRYGCTECQSAFSIYLVSNASKESLLSQDFRWSSFEVIDWRGYGSTIKAVSMSRHSSKNYTNQFAVEIN